MILEPCAERKKACVKLPQGLEDEYLYFYMGMMFDFGVCIPFTIVQEYILKAINISPSWLHLNNWAFVRGFEIICVGVGIWIFFSFYESKEVNYGGGISWSVIPCRAFFSSYSLNYKIWKYKFLWVWGGLHCLEFIYEEDDTHMF